MIGQDRGTERLLALNHAAIAERLSIGMGVAEARAFVPSLVTSRIDRGKLRRAKRQMGLWLSRFTPWVGMDEHPFAAQHGATFFADVSGCTHLFGGAEALLTQMRLSLARHGFTARLAMAHSPSCAYGLALFDGRAAHGLYLDDKAARTAALALPTAALRVPLAQINGLLALGLTSIGQILQMGRAGLARRFGPALIKAIDGALGDEDAPITPLRPKAAYRVKVHMAEPLMTQSGLETAILRALNNLCASLSEHGQAVGRIRLLCHRVDGHVLVQHLSAGRPHVDVDIWGRIMRLHLQRQEGRLDLGFGIDLVEAEAVTTCPISASAVDLDPDQGARAKNADHIIRLAERLSARLDKNPDYIAVGRLMRVDVHRPEQAQRWVSALSPAHLPQSLKRQDPQFLPPSAPLAFLRPEPVEAMAEVPDGPPRLFRWRKQLFRIASAEGPIRYNTPNILGDADPKARDDYYVQTDSGRRFWLARHGGFVAIEDPLAAITDADIAPKTSASKSAPKPSQWFLMAAH